MINALRKRISEEVAHIQKYIEVMYFEETTRHEKCAVKYESTRMVETSYIYMYIYIYIYISYTPGLYMYIY